MKKYKLLRNDHINYNGITLYRIKALKDFGDVKEGQVGGYIEGEHNLSQKGLCWVSDNAKVCGAAKVFDNARVSDSAWVNDNARVFDNAKVSGSAGVFGDALVDGYAVVNGNAKVFDDAWVSDYAKLFGNVEVYDSARVYGDTWAYGNALVSGYARLFGNVKVFGDMIATRCVYSSRTHEHIITLSDDHISIGCEVHTIEYWKKHIEEVGRDNGYSDKQIRATKKMLNSMLMFRDSEEV